LPLKKVFPFPLSPAISLTLGDADLTIPSYLL
jgi:hypothetical protein